MIDFDQLRRDLDGATPGHWEASPHRWPQQIGCCPLVGRPFSIHSGVFNVAASNTIPDARLIAAAPDLAKLALLVPELRDDLMALRELQIANAVKDFAAARGDEFRMVDSILAKLDEALK